MAERQYVGDGITVLWDSDRCIHSAHCWKALPQVFNPRVRPWVDVSAADAETIRTTVDGCPSGALGYVIEEQLESETVTEVELPTPSVTIQVTADGPLEVLGPVRLVDAEGGLVEESDRQFLCRCGHSANKPFCDGSHRKVGFTHSGMPATDD